MLIHIDVFESEQSNFNDSNIKFEFILDTLFSTSYNKLLIFNIGSF